MNVDSDIPGFCFDPVTKRYYRIQASSTGEHFTKENLYKNHKEKKRKEDLKSNQKLNRTKTTKNLKQGNGLLTFKTNLQEGSMKQSVFKNFHEELLLKILLHSPSFSSVPFYPAFQNVSKTQVSTENSTEFLCLCKLKSRQACNGLQTLQIKPHFGANSTHGSFAITPTSSVIKDKPCNLVKHMCWAQTDSLSKALCYVTFSDYTHLHSRAVFCEYKENSWESHFYNLDHPTKVYPRECAWNKGLSMIGYAHDQGLGLINFDLNKKQRFGEQFGDCLSLTFSESNNSNLLFAGFKRSAVRLFDLRTKSTHVCLTLKHKSSVCCVKSLSTNPTNLLASDYSGEIRLWDLRINRSLMTYHGVNEYTKLPFSINESAGIIYSAGQDCYTRIWSLKSGELLTCIPPPLPASRDNIPSLFYVDTDDQYHEMPGLLLTMDSGLFFYPHSFLAKDS